MKKLAHGCPKCVDEKPFVKNGRTKNGKQRFKCKECHHTFLTNYSYKACEKHVNSQIKLLLKEGVGIRSMSRILGISKDTVMRRILIIASRLVRPSVFFGQCYELDEMCTFIGNKDKRYWVVYAINQKTKQPIDFRVGKRTNKTLRQVINTLLLSNPVKIFTDKLRNYKYLIPKEIHSTKWRGTNGIENKNLSLRTNLRRLQRRSICFSKSKIMLIACLKIYFWG